MNNKFIFVLFTGKLIFMKLKMTIYIYNQYMISQNKKILDKMFYFIIYLIISHL